MSMIRKHCPRITAGIAVPADTGHGSAQPQDESFQLQMAAPLCPLVKERERKPRGAREKREKRARRAPKRVRRAKARRKEVENPKPKLSPPLRPQLFLIL